jgi:hypothetical protein
MCYSVQHCTCLVPYEFWGACSSPSNGFKILQYCAFKSVCAFKSRVTKYIEFGQQFRDTVWDLHWINKNGRTLPINSKEICITHKKRIPPCLSGPTKAANLWTICRANCWRLCPMLGLKMQS